MKKVLKFLRTVYFTDSPESELQITLNRETDRFWEIVESIKNNEIKTVPLKIIKNFSLLLEIAKKSKAEVIAIKNLAEFLRSLDSTALFFRFIAEASVLNIRFISLEDNLDTSSAAHVFFSQSTKIIKDIKKHEKRKNILKKMLAAKLSGVHIGRPKKVDDKKVKDLRNKGLSLNKISKQLNISKGAVQYSLRQSQK